MYCLIKASTLSEDCQRDNKQGPNEVAPNTLCLKELVNQSWATINNGIYLINLTTAMWGLFDPAGLQSS